MIAFLSRWVITTAALALAAQLIDGIWFEGATRGSAEVEDKIVDLVVVALISCVITAFVKPVLTILSIPFILVTLGLFLIVVNALVLQLVVWLSGVWDLGFESTGFFWATFLGAIVLSIATWLLGIFVPDGDT